MMHYKKIVLIMASLCLLHDAHAGTMADSKSGFYAAVGLGDIGMRYKNSAFVSNRYPVSTSLNSSTDYGNIGFNGIFLGGYSVDFLNGFMLGVEAFGTITNTGAGKQVLRKVNISSLDIAEPTILQAQLNSTYGLRALPGYQITPEVVTYGIIGYERAHLNVSVPAITSTANTFTNTVPASSINHNFNGCQLGIGSMISVTRHVAIRGDITYSFYQKKSIGSNNNQLSTTEADVSVVYKFG